MEIVGCCDLAEWATEEIGGKCRRMNGKMEEIRIWASIVSIHFRHHEPLAVETVFHQKGEGKFSTSILGEIIQERIKAYKILDKEN